MKFVQISFTEDNAVVQLKSIDVAKLVDWKLQKTVVSSSSSNQLKFCSHMIVSAVKSIILLKWQWQGPQTTSMEKKKKGSNKGFVRNGLISW